MGQESDKPILQAIEEVRQNPGSPAFAIVAEHHLQQGKLEAALRVCQQGFLANPSHEQGALVYLSVIRRLRQPDEALRILGQARKHLPGAPRLHLLVAHTLREAHRFDEALEVALEALGLDPTLREAELVVGDLRRRISLPGPPVGYQPPALGQDPRRQDPSSPGKPPLFLTDDVEIVEPHEEPGSPPKAHLRPLTKRIRTAPTFDLTPGPVVVRQQAPLQVGSRGVMDPRVMDTDVDISPRPHLDPDLEQELELHEEPPKEPDLIGEPAEPTRAKVLPGPRPPPPPPLPDQGPSDQPGPPPTPIIVPPPVPRLPVLPGRLPTRAGPPLRPVPGSVRRRRRTWLWVLLVLMSSAAGVAGGILHYRVAAERNLLGEVEQALQATSSDLWWRYQEARTRLVRLSSEHPDDMQVQAALALVSAHLLARFGADASSLLEPTRTLLARVLGTLPGNSRALAASALLAVKETRPEQALIMLAPLAGADQDWHTQLAASLALLSQGKLAESGQILDRATRAFPRAVALLYEAARLHCGCGREKQARQLLTRALRISPSHLGLLLQEGLLGAGGQASTLSVQRAEALVRSSAKSRVTRYMAHAALLRAMVAGRARSSTKAIQLGEQALRLMPRDPQIAAWLGHQHLGPGGDAGRASALLLDQGAALSSCLPLVSLWQARALLLRGRPQEAHKVLARIPRGKLEEHQRTQRKVLEVYAAEGSGDTESTDQLCSQGTRTRPLPAQLAVACVEALVDRGELRRARQEARHMGSGQASVYLKGLAALARGDAAAAVSVLSRVKTDALPDPVAPVLALARAHLDLADAPRAITLLREAVSLDARSARSRVALAGALAAVGQVTEAVTTLDQALASDPAHPSLLSEAAGIRLRLGLPSRADELVRQGLKLAPRSLPLLLMAGHVAFVLGRTEEARSFLTEALKVSRGSAKALVALGQLEATTGAHHKALRLFEQALRRKARDPEVLLLLSQAHAALGDFGRCRIHGNRAVALLLRAGQQHRALLAQVELGRLLRSGDQRAQSAAKELLLKATTSPAAPAVAFLEFGLLHRQQGDLNRTIWCLRQAVQRDPNLAEAQLELGQVLASQRRWRRQARRPLERFLELRPDGAEAKRVRALLRRLR